MRTSARREEVGNPTLLLSGRASLARAGLVKTSRPSPQLEGSWLKGSMQLPELSIDSLGNSERIKSYGIAFDDFVATALSTSDIEVFSDEIYLKDSCS